MARRSSNVWIGKAGTALTLVGGTALSGSKSLGLGINTALGGVGRTLITTALGLQTGLHLASSETGQFLRKDIPRYIKRHPYASSLIVFGAGVAVGLLITRRK